MKSLVFTLVIALILQDYGTLQDKLEALSSSDLAEIFKKHALDLVTAAIQPLSKNEELVEGACACLKMTPKKANWSPFDQILAIMSIAKDHSSDLEVIRATSKLSTLQIKPELTQNIRAIVLGHKYSSSKRGILANVAKLGKVFGQKNSSGSTSSFSTDVPTLGREYLRTIRHKLAGNEEDDESWQPDVNCYRTILTIYGGGQNKDFFEPLAEGLVIVGALISGVAKDSQNDRPKTRLREIIGQIREYDVKVHSLDDAIEQFENLIDSLDEDQKADSDED